MRARPTLKRSAGWSDGEQRTANRTRAGVDASANRAFVVLLLSGGLGDTRLTPAAPRHRALSHVVWSNVVCSCYSESIVRDVEAEWFQMKVQGRVLTARGAAFQDFFADLMEAAYPGDFERVRAYGKKGDLKCDGFLKSAGQVFQVYAPRETKEAAMVAKVKADFAGAKKAWAGKMKHWTFVHNDGEGLPPGVVQLLAAIATKHQGIVVDSWPPSRLETVALTIPRATLVSMFGRPPQRHDLEALTFEPVGRVVAAIKGQSLASLDPIAPVSPDKLAANSLSEGVVEYLSMGRRRELLVQDYFDHHPNPTFGEEVAAAFRIEYARLRSDGHSPDEIFAALQAFAGGSTRREAEHEAAVLAVLSYLFERCDIFEAPAAGLS